jgi:hypothetical protein
MEQNNLFKEYKGIFEAEEARENSNSKEKKERTFGYSPFALQDALGERSAKKAWIEYQKLRLAGIEEEELIHKIVSKIKDMAAIIMGAGKEELGLKDYPYNKSKRDSRNWGKEELEKLYTKLVEIYHNSRIRGDNLDVAIEKTLLGI